MPDDLPGGDLMTQTETRPPIPASLADRPVRGGLAQPWVNVQLADGGTDFRSTHRTRAEQAWKECLCQSCGNPAAPYAVMVCGPRQILSGRFDEPPVCPPCALYASGACRVAGGLVVAYQARPSVVSGHRGERCGDPGCGCAGWTDIDPEHSADMGGQPVLPWYAAWHRPARWDLTGHWAKVRCSDKGCEHDRLMITGAQIGEPPLKVLLISEPGVGRIWAPLTAEQAREHATRALEASC